MSTTPSNHDGRRIMTRVVGLALAAGTFAGAVPILTAYAADDVPDVPVVETRQIPRTADDAVLEVLQHELDERDASELVRLATFETAWVESHANNLAWGDRDSQGVFQQRPSQGWGSIEEVTDVEYAVNAFLDQAIPTAERNPHRSAGWISQAVQRSAFPDRYDESESIARDLMDRAEELTEENAAS